MAMVRRRPKYVTYEEFEPVKKRTDALTAQMQLLTIRVEVLANDLHQLRLQVADIAEDLVSLRAEFRRELNAGFAAMSKKIEEGNAALLAAIMRPPRARG